MNGDEGRSRSTLHTKCKLVLLNVVDDKIKRGEKTEEGDVHWAIP